MSQSLDHLILFLPVDPSTNLPQLPSFFSENFTLTPGGFHADGATSNTLIVLQDGCYIELISFIDASKAPSHWWGPDAKFLGWKDWCLTNASSPEENFEKLKESHGEPVRGGRKRPDGVDVKWAVTFPKGEKGGQEVRGRVPFFCHDITERGVRVPLLEERMKHPSGALGVRRITVVVKDKAVLEETKKVYRAILGTEGVPGGDEVHFEVGRVQDVVGLVGGSKIVLRLPKDEDEAGKTAPLGFWYGDVVLGAKATAQQAQGTTVRLDGGGDDVRGVWLEYV